MTYNINTVSKEKLKKDLNNIAEFRGHLNVKEKLVFFKIEGHREFTHGGGEDLDYYIKGHLLDELEQDQEIERNASKNTGVIYELKITEKGKESIGK